MIGSKAGVIRALRRQGYTSREIARLTGYNIKYIAPIVSIFENDPHYKGRWMKKKRESDPAYYQRELDRQRERYYTLKKERAR